MTKYIEQKVPTHRDGIKMYKKMWLFEVTAVPTPVVYGSETRVPTQSAEMSFCKFLRDGVCLYPNSSNDSSS